MKKSQIVLTQYSPFLSVDTPLIAPDGSSIEIPRVCSLSAVENLNISPCATAAIQQQVLQDLEKNSRRWNRSTM